MDVWGEASLAHRLKIERTLNFTTMPHEEDEYSYSQKKIARDPMSHRIIEKRRRDRMNNCLADLSRLIPPTYLKKGRGRIEKTEIIEMATKHLRHLQAHACKDPATCEVSLQQRDEFSSRTVEDSRRQEEAALQRQRDQHRLGFQECSSETIRFLVESEGFDPGQGICLRLLQHLQAHYEKLVQGVCYMGGDNHGESREEGPTNNGQSIMLPHQEDIHLFHLDSNSNQSLCESYQRQTNVGSQSGVGVISRPLKRSASQISDCPSNSVDVLRLGHPPTERIGSRSVRVTEEDTEDDHSRHVNFGVGNDSVIERSVSVTSPRLFTLPGPGHSRSHLRDILNQDSCPASYEQKRLRSNSIDSTRSCRIITGVLPSQGYHTSDVYCNRSAEEVYKFKNNIKERFRADVLHHNMDHPNASVSLNHGHHEPMGAPNHGIISEAFPKLATGESFGISRMFPTSGSVSGVCRNERSFATLNGFGSFATNNGELAVNIPVESNTVREVSRLEPPVEHPSSRSSSCGSNPSPNSMSSNCFNQTGATSNNACSNNSGGEGAGNKATSSSGHSSTSGYSTSGEGSSNISVRDKNARNSSCSSSSPSSSRNNTDGENSPNCHGLLKMEDQTLSNECGPKVPVSLVPVFALHPKGTFYIPLTLESTTLAPHLRGRELISEPENTLSLHPISISVCFYPGILGKERNQPLDNWRSKRERDNTYEEYQEKVY